MREFPSDWDYSLVCSWRGFQLSQRRGETKRRGRRRSRRSFSFSAPTLMFSPGPSQRQRHPRPSDHQPGWSGVNQIGGVAAKVLDDDKSPCGFLSFPRFPRESKFIGRHPSSPAGPIEDSLGFYFLCNSRATSGFLVIRVLMGNIILFLLLMSSSLPSPLGLQEEEGD